MIKRCANLSLTYGVIAMAFGVFYREFTKFSGFTGRTNLSFLHTHYFMLGMFFFLLLMLAEKAFSLLHPQDRTGPGGLSGRTEHYRPWLPAAGPDPGLGDGPEPRPGRLHLRCRGHRPHPDGRQPRPAPAANSEAGVLSAYMGGRETCGSCLP